MVLLTILISLNKFANPYLRKKLKLNGKRKIYETKKNKTKLTLKI